MAIYGPMAHIWPYMVHIWSIYGPYMTIYGHIWPYMAHMWPILWSYMAHIWLYMAIYGDIWPYMGHIWPIYGPYMAIFRPLARSGRYSAARHAADPVLAPSVSQLRDTVLSEVLVIGYEVLDPGYKVWSKGNVIKFFLSSTRFWP